ncbi:MAG: HNH endonuclease [Desulfobacteraceae bacterium]|nr:HNH endonuclease [Desulfobacteraceae bacterium]
MSKKIDKINRSCECGCGGSFVCKANSKRRFIHGHNKQSFRWKKGCTPWNKGKEGEQGTRWAGGRRKHGDGYVQIFSPNHPCKDKNNYVLEHRLVMEAHIGRSLLPTEVVHHINEVRDDNRIENLMLFPNNGAHLKYELTAKNEGV